MRLLHYFERVQIKQKGQQSSFQAPGDNKTTSSQKLKKGHAVVNVISPTEAGTSNATSSTADSLYLQYVSLQFIMSGLELSVLPTPFLLLLLIPFYSIIPLLLLPYTNDL